MTEKITALAVRAVPCLFGTKQKPNQSDLNQCDSFISAVVLTLLASSLTLNAQQKVKPIGVGEKIPAIFWNQKHHVYVNGIASTQKLVAHRGKYIILDFWATWCGSCISQFETLDSLEKANPSKLKIILVNSIGTADSEEKVQSFLKQNPLSIPTIYQDTILQQMFPHRYVPHYVWINKQGVVEAITGSSLVHSINMEALISNP